MREASKTPTEFLVFALRPCRVLDKAIQQAKANTEALVGDQVYLSHPPHLTLYVAAFDSPESIVEPCAAALRSWTQPRFQITGWHYFEGDVLTGNQTLVCEIDEQGKQELRSYQRRIVEALAELRNENTSMARYLPHFNSLSAERRSAVEQCGFPFVGDDWIPHFTVASINPKQWSTVWNQLKDAAPHGVFTCESLSIFRLKNDFPHPFHTLPISG